MHISKIHTIISKMSGPYDYKETERILAEAHRRTQERLSKFESEDLQIGGENMWAVDNKCFTCKLQKEDQCKDYQEVQDAVIALQNKPAVGSGTITMECTNHVSVFETKK